MYQNDDKKLYNILRSSSQNKNVKKLAGFDIETADNNKTFLFCSYESDNAIGLFFKKEHFIKFLQRVNQHNKYTFATNLGFDFFGTFFGGDYISKFKFIFRGSDLLSAKTYIDNKEFSCKRCKSGRYILFIDTFNFCKMSVKNLGSIVNLNKSDIPSFIGKNPKDIPEWIEIIKYNLNDTKISFEFAKFLQNAIRTLGGDMKLTISSSALKLFRNKYLKENYFVHSKDVLDDLFKAYYGGRTEVFKRGEFENLYYHDINSMYPYVMSQLPLPNPNSLHVNKLGSISNIMDYEGVSEVLIHIPYMKFPILPYRQDSKLIFPYGFLKGFYTHVEIREALSLGAKLIEIGKSFYYTKTHYPFREYIEELYEKRLNYQKDKNQMEKIVKLFMNSLYGKFAQKYDNVKVMKHIDSCTIHDLHEEHEQIGDFVSIKKVGEPYNFSFPIWSIYITANARIMLHRYIREHNPVYVDTDSLITDHVIEDSKLLGHLKIENILKKSVFVRPKMYAFIDENDKPTIKCKGIATKNMSYERFKELLLDFKVYDERFIKFKSAIRRKLVPNEIIFQPKEYDIQDTKRIWKSDFNISEIQDSEPIMVNDLPQNLYTHYENLLIIHD
jgi:hypothetical protein